MDVQGTWRKANGFSVAGGQTAREKRREEGKARWWGGNTGLYEQEERLDFVHCAMGRLWQRFAGRGQEDGGFVSGERTKGATVEAGMGMSVKLRWR